MAITTDPRRPPPARIRHRWRLLRVTRSYDEEIEALRPPNRLTFLPWLLMGVGALSHLLQGEAAQPWLGGLGLLAFNSLYIAVVFTAFDPRAAAGKAPRRYLLALAAVTYALAIGYGGTWLVFFPLLSLAAGIVARGRRTGPVLVALAVSAGIVAGLRSGDLWEGVSIGYGSLISGLVTAAMLTLHDAVTQLRATRQELARNAVAEERLRFSRDLHDLLGHTLSVVVVKAEAARRLAPRDPEAALAQVADIEAIGRQALTEIREAVTGYREGSWSTELDRARSALAAAGIEAVVQESGPPPPRTGALLGWVVREGVTNVVRHSAAATCRIELTAAGGRVRLRITDDGRGVGSAPGTGSGLRGLAERLAAAGGSLATGPAPGGGFRVEAELPEEEGQAA
ncbi:sensor histidine kinase [Actinacidiphila sp. bgisy167]|uniref:sensor histidine kinase n=1 Tax=Actinacidiphila sp. bgisy167 TaxID=3413797 RepID=UPI003D75CFAF